MPWMQTYDPFGHWWLSTLCAALPIIVLFVLLAGLRVRPHLERNPIIAETELRC